MKRSHALDDRQRIERIKAYREMIAYWEHVQLVRGHRNYVEDIRDLESHIGSLNGYCDGINRGLRRKRLVG